MRIECVAGDITGQSVDVIVNAANSSLLGGGGVDGAIHRRGGPEVLAACKEVRATTHPDGLPTGQAVATTAGRLDARWVVHVVGPVWAGAEAAERGRRALLASCFTEALRVSSGLGARSVAFPAVSAGVYGWPMEDAARTAVAAVRAADRDGVAAGVELVRFVLFGGEAHAAFSAALAG
ncbi:MAG TPA: O-acetyl-ADP-ribose deacetylase [Mycobacteriales bacterium]|nr:O-acetyl-ADP-ribose deacetylase [Mycobacteriales bacterium]